MTDISTTPDTTPDTLDGMRRSRRGLLGAAAVATTAAAAALTNDRTVHAADDDPIVLGSNLNNSTSETVVSGPSLTFRDQSSQGSLARLVNGVPTGLHGYTGGEARSRAVWGQSETVDGVGVYGGHWSRSNGFGVVAESLNGSALLARGTADDVALAGSGRLRFITTQVVGPTSPGSVGTLARDASGSLWYCFATNRWQQLAGPASAGSFVPVDPTRVYDSRVPAPLFGTLPSGQNRVLSVAFGRDLATGSVIENDLVPVGATAVTYNLTATGTINSGFLSMVPGDVGVVRASTINWTASNTTVANAGTVRLDANRQVNVICGGINSGSDFLIDITGYYR